MPELNLERERRALGILAEILEEPAPQRQDALAAACAADAGLRDRVARLLAAHDSTITLRTHPEDRRPPERTGSFRENEIVAQRFRIVRFRGAGGMGEVYEAFDQELSENVAIKTVRAELLDREGFEELFRSEIRLARRVSHRSVCRVYDVAFHKGAGDGPRQAIISMQLLEGESLADLLRRREAIPGDQAEALLVQMIDGLAALHDAHIAHRDLKPGNFIINMRDQRGPRAWITDFGLAQSQQAGVSKDSGATPAFGTPDYMAPEQLEGAAAAGQSGDIYALGLTAAELLSGRALFADLDPFEWLRIRLEDDMDALLAQSELPAKWAPTLRRCLKRKPEDRYANAGEIARALRSETTEQLAPGTGDIPPEPVARRNAADSVHASDEPSRNVDEPVSRRMVLATALASLVAVAAGLYLVVDGPAPPDPMSQQLVILPFEAAASDTRIAVLAQGLPDALASALTETADPANPVYIIPYREVLASSVRSVSEARDLLGATQVVTGTLQPRGDGIQLVLSLAETTQMRQRNSRRFEVRSSEVAALERVASAQLAAWTGLTLTEAARPRAEPTAYDFFAQARSHLLRPDLPFNLDAAKALLEKAIEHDPDFALAYAYMGRAHWYAYELELDPGHLDKALESCRSAARMAPRDPAVLLEYGLMLSRAKQFQQAAATLQAAIGAGARDWEAYLGLMETYEGLGNPQAAEAQLAKLESSQSGSWYAYHQLSRYYYRHGRFDEAMTQLEHAAELAPLNPWVANGLAVLHERLGDYEEAERIYQDSARRHPHYVVLSVNLATLEFESGRDGEAIAIVRETLDRTDSKWHTAWGELAEMTYWQGSEGPRLSRPLFERAIGLAESRLQTEPANAVLLAYLAGFHARVGEAADAKKLLQQAAELDSDNPRWMARAGEVYVMLGEEETGKELLLRSLDAGYRLHTLERIRTIQPIVASDDFQRRLKRLELARAGTI